MKVGIQIILILFSLGAYAQECIYLKNEQDEFTKSFVKQTEWQTVAFVRNSKESNHLQFSMINVDGVSSLLITITDTKAYGSNTSYCLNSSSKIYLLFENGNSIPLNYVGKINCESYGSKVDRTLQIAAAFEIDDSIMNGLVGSPLKKIRIQFNEGRMEYDILNPNDVNKRMKLAGQSLDFTNYFSISTRCIR